MKVNRAHTSLSPAIGAKMPVDAPSLPVRARNVIYNIYTNDSAGGRLPASSSVSTRHSVGGKAELLINKWAIVQFHGFETD